MRIELNLVNIDLFICFQDLDKLYNKWLKPHKLHINHSSMTICCFFQCHTRYSSYSFLVSTSTQSWRSEGPQGPKAQPLGTPSLVQTGRKNHQKCCFSMFFQGLHGRNVWLSICLKLVYVFCFNVCFKTDGWDSKKMEEAKVRRFSSNNIRQLRLKRSTTAWTMRIDERSGATEKKRCNCRIGKIQLNPWSASGAAPLRPWILSSAQWRMTCCYTQNCITSWWHILSRILLLDICLEMWSCKLRYARKGMSKGETNVCTSPRWAAKVESLSMLNPNRQAVRAEYNVDWAKKCGTRWDRLENLTSQPGPVVF